MKLWKENRIDRGYEIENKQLAKLFIASHYNHLDKPLIYKITLFIGSADGLNSSIALETVEERKETSKQLNEISKIVRTKQSTFPGAKRIGADYDA